MKDFALIHELERHLVKKIADGPDHDLAPTIANKSKTIPQTMKIIPIRTILIPTQIILIPIPIDLYLQKV